ncbi:MAG TPA: alanyl-tRNA editing protein [Hypericibacter adhaerens]|jgi:misacylated tRNA(Ala) deacylase|uniref:Alanine--tRNA ligase n=1 Tax=Hypericibacter adhaerens TaxID=2602016 RepID=A0A5J6N006_9PROT|nr:alanyl-tRNA editing protein [Hypericibacter adhaerens]QEX22453.1 Ala-tRNA(Pro) hydrolase [Hypericibacter adhaerens]HWA43512.1 alanyl-tRNA editing protein [Hypericibacter adhaerens]
MTQLLFRDDAYTQRCTAKVLAADANGIVLDRTVFYPMGGGQPGDTGRLRLADGREIAILDTVKGAAPDEVLHKPAPDSPLPAVGSEVEAVIDWERRHRLMRMHTTLHLLCAVVIGDVTGGQVGDGKGRLDFNLPEAPDRATIEAALNKLIAEDHPVRPRWITDEELAARPELVRTMSVKPPSGQGRVRLLEIESVDLQPCGGTHVARTGEIGPISVGKIENKGKQNRRINLAFAGGAA